jgi:hypothetical protein
VEKPGAQHSHDPAEHHVTGVAVRVQLAGRTDLDRPAELGDVGLDRVGVVGPDEPVALETGGVGEQLPRRDDRRCPFVGETEVRQNVPHRTTR